MLLIRRLGGIAFALAVLATGCAKAPPVVSIEPATPAPTPVAALQIGTDGTSTLNLVAALYAGALTASGQPATVVNVVPGTETLAIADHSPVAMPAFAGTLLQQFDKAPTASAEDVIADLATAVAPKLKVVDKSKVDGRLVWAVTPKAASSGTGNLTAVGTWGADKVVDAPSFALSNPSGAPLLSVAYGSKATVRAVDDPAARHAALLDGSAAAAGFRLTDSADLGDLVTLDDPIGASTPDPLVVLLAADLADNRPDAVLTLIAVQDALTPESLASLTQDASESGTPAAVAEWLKVARLDGSAPGQ